MKINKIERAGDTIQLRFMKETGAPHRGTLGINDLDGLDAYITAISNCEGEEVDLSRCDEIRALASVEFPEDSELARIDFKCGPDALTDDGKYIYPADCYVLQAKTKDKKVRGDGRAIGAAFCYQHTESGEWLDTNMDSEESSVLPQEFKDCFKALASITQTIDGVEVRRNPELFKLMAIENQERAKLNDR